MSTSLRIIFAGTPNFAAHHLDNLLSSGHQIICVFTQPDKQAGRGKKFTQTPVKMLAKKNGLPVFLPTSLLTQESQEFISKLNADIIVVVAYSLLFPEIILKTPRFGCINVHPSLLPRWRGAAPIPRSILAGDVTTGITIIKMDVGLDSGDIIYKLPCPIASNDTSETLCAKLAKLGSQGLIKTLQQIVKRNLQPQKQDDTQATYANKIDRQEARIDWSLSAVQLERCIRAFNPWPISWLKIDANKIVKIYKASVIKTSLRATPGTIIDTNKQGIQILTANNILNLELLQPANKKIMSAIDFLNAYRTWFIPGGYIK